MNPKATSVVAVAMLATLLTGCGSSEVFTDERDANPDVVAEAYVGSEALLRPSEFPQGWSPTQANPEAPDPEVAASRQVVDTCSGVDISYQSGFARTLVYGDVFIHDGDAWLEQTLGVDNVVAVDEIMARFAAADAPECLAAEFKAALQNEFDGSSADDGITVRSVRADSVAIPEVGDLSVGYRISATVEAGDGQRSVYLDLRFTRVGDTISVLAARSAGEVAIDPAELDLLTENSVKRLPVDVN